jgi:dUTP pyrophosphatase
VNPIRKERKVEGKKSNSTKRTMTADCTFKVRRLSEHSSLPMRASDGAAGYDLTSAHDYVVSPQNKAIICTDLSINVPDGTYGRIAPRSGLAAKRFIDVGAGVIDADYRGNVGVVLFNHAQEEFVVKRGDRIAQLILERIVTPDVTEVSDFEEKEHTQRGQGGFGSTG